MSLNWDLRKIADHTTKCWDVAAEDQPWNGAKKGDRVLNPITNGLIMLTMQIGIGEITADNVDEVFDRISLLEKLFGSQLKSQAGDHPFTRQHVEDHVGLHTNVFPKEPEGKWVKRVYETWRRENAQAHNRAIARAGEAAS